VVPRELLRSAIVAATLSLGATTASGATQPSLTLTPATVHRGGSVLISGSAGSCRVGDTVVVISRGLPRTHEFAGLPAVWARVRAGGRFATRVRIPLAKPPGRYAVTARCGGGNLGILARLTVLR
jgi:hypothetical protein